MTERELRWLGKAERLARAVLLFHSGGRWGPQRQREWEMLTGASDATTRQLCDLARTLLGECTLGLQRDDH